MRKFFSSCLAFIVVLVTLTIPSHAASTEIKFACTSSTVTVGNQFEVVFSVTSLGDFPSLYGASGVLEYDSNYVDYVSISAKNGWNSPTYNANNGRISILSDSAKSTGDVFSIKFKLKALPSSATPVINLSSISLASEDNELEFDNALSIKITAKEPTPVNNTVNNTVTNNTVNNTTNNTVTNNTVNNTVENNTINNVVENNTINNTVNNTTNNTINNTPSVVLNTSNNSTGNVVDNTITAQYIPYTGLNTVIIMSIVGVSVVGIIAYRKYKHLNI